MKGVFYNDEHLLPFYNDPTRVNHFFICAFYNKFRLFRFTLGSVPEFVPLVPAMFRSKEREKV